MWHITIIFTALLWFVAAVIILWLIMVLATIIKRKIREHKISVRIRAQAIALGIWDKPQALGGKALTLSARENFGIRRKRGEGDWELRRRCMHMADEELANAPRC